MMVLRFDLTDYFIAMEHNRILFRKKADVSAH